MYILVYIRPSANIYPYQDFILPYIGIDNNSKAYTNLVFWGSLVCSLGCITIPLFLLDKYLMRQLTIYLIMVQPLCVCSECHQSVGPVSAGALKAD